MALARRKRARLHILAEMRKVMSAPNPKLSELVPQIVAFKVPTDKIGAIIGTGGKDNSRHHCENRLLPLI